MEELSGSDWHVVTSFKVGEVSMDSMGYLPFQGCDALFNGGRGRWCCPVTLDVEFFGVGAALEDLLLVPEVSEADVRS